MIVTKYSKNETKIEQSSTSQTQLPHNEKINDNLLDIKKDIKNQTLSAQTIAVFMLLGLSLAYQENFSIKFVFLKVATIVANQALFIHHYLAHKLWLKTEIPYNNLY